MTEHELFAANGFEDYEDKLDLENEFVREQLEWLYKQVELWAEHLGLEIVDLDEGIEVKLPDGGIFHVDPFEVYVIGSYERNRLEGNDEMIVKQVKYNDENEYRGNIMSKPLREATITLDKKYGTIRAGRKAIGGPMDYVRLSVFKEDIGGITENWKEMTKEKRYKVFKELPASHHKEILREQLQAAGIDVPNK